MSDCISRSEHADTAPDMPDQASTVSGSHGFQCLTDIDRQLILLTQNGLPLTPEPYRQLGDQLALSADEVMARLERMKAVGIIRRIAAVPNHYRLGYRVNGMTVWDVADEQIRTLGLQVGELPYVSHCYHRPRRLPDWPYNLFVMVHGRNHEGVSEHIAGIADLLGEHCRQSDVLFSSRILKKTGLRLRSEDTSSGGL